jgi:hypothetical protein
MNKLLAILFAAIILLAGCGSTRLVTSWRDPSVTVQEGSLSKVLYIALLKDEATRRTAEDELVIRSTARGVASYTYFGSNIDAINSPGMNERMVRDGIDGVVIMRLVDLSKEQTYVPGTVYPTYFGSPYGYYGFAAPMYYNPGYVRTDVIYTVETNIYSTRSGKLVWTGTTNTVDPTSLGTTVREIMEEIHWQMVKEGFLTKAPKW